MSRLYVADGKKWPPNTENCCECNKKRANVDGSLDLRLAGALQLFTVKNVSCYTGFYGGPGT